MGLFGLSREDAGILIRSTTKIANAVRSLSETVKVQNQELAQLRGEVNKLKQDLHNETVCRKRLEERVEKLENMQPRLRQKPAYPGGWTGEETPA